MVLLIVLLLALTALLSLLLPMLYAREVYRARHGVHQVTCPETRRTVAVEIDALHCAATSLAGTEYMRLSGCSRWPEKRDCDQGCVYELFEARAEVKAAKPALPHAAVLVGASTAWLLGALWYAEPVFGRTWMRLHGLTEQAARGRAESVVPYLVPAAGFLLLGYVIALAQRALGNLGLIRAAALAVAGCAAFLALDLVLRTAFPAEWLSFTWVETVYALAGSVLTAVIVHSWPRLKQTLAS